MDSIKKRMAFGLKTMTKDLVRINTAPQSKLNSPDARIEQAK